MRRALPVINHRPDLSPVAAVGVHHPNVRVFHSGLAIRQAAPRSAKEDALAVRRPKRVVFVGFRCRDAAHAAIRHAQCENIVIEKLVLVRFRIRQIQNLLSIRRPVDRMLVRVAFRELPNLFGCDADDENMQALVVVEARHAFAGVRLVQIACNHHGVAAGFRRPAVRRRRNVCNLLPVGRPRQLIAGPRQRAVRAFG